MYDNVPYCFTSVDISFLFIYLSQHTFIPIPHIFIDYLHLGFFRFVSINGNDLVLVYSC